jgi:hypothetical protein
VPLSPTPLVRRLLVAGFHRIVLAALSFPASPSGDSTCPACGIVLGNRAVHGAHRGSSGKMAIPDRPLVPTLATVTR